MKTRVMGLMMLAGYAAHANAEGVTATKKSGGQQVMDNLYGDVEARVTTWRFYDKAGNTQATRDLALRPKLGTKVMNERLDLNLTLPILNRQNSVVSEQARPEAYAELSIYENEHVDVNLNTTNYMQTKDGAYEAYLDLDTTVKHKFAPLAAGTFNVSCLIELESTLSTQKAEANILSREHTDGTALTDIEDKNTDTPQQKSNTKSIYVYPKISYEPAAIAGLTFSLGSIMGPSYTQKYNQTVDASTGESKLKEAGYEVRVYSQNRYTVKYAINSDISVYNQLRQNVRGYNEERMAPGQPELENRTGITMNLF
jgi:hypothetical protein